jgi:hypothetical protein
MNWLGCASSNCCFGSISSPEDEYFYSQFVEDSHAPRIGGTADTCPALHAWHSSDAPQLTPIRVIGRGTYARVLLVERGLTGKLYAMKSVRQDESVDLAQVRSEQRPRDQRDTCKAPSPAAKAVAAIEPCAVESTLLGFTHTVRRVLSRVDISRSRVTGTRTEQALGVQPAFGRGIFCSPPGALSDGMST